MSIRNKILLLAVLLPFCAVTAQADEALPLGDGKMSSGPQVGYIWSCQQQMGGGGAFRNGDWIQGNVWYPDKKIHVQGDVQWHSEISVSTENGLRVVKANDLPEHGTGIFPVQRNDPAYNFDRNPNSISAQQVLFYLPLDPQEAQYPSCAGGSVGFSLSGAWIFNGMDAEGRDAVAHEVQDKCNGHPQDKGRYHYHGPSPCMKDESGEAGRHSDLIGYAFDGFGIYGTHGDNGKELTDADLDACHGHKHKVMWNGKLQEIYHYHMTNEFPYSVGCFKGTVVNRHAEFGGQTEQDATQMRQMLQGTNTQSPQKGQQPQGQWQQQGQRQPQGQWGGEKMQQGMQQQRRDPAAILQGAAQALGVNAETLRNAIGGPPPDFGRASQVLGIPAEQIHAAFVHAGAPN